MKKTIELSISTSYVKDWGIKEGVREILQNAIDQESANSDNVKTIDYTGDILTISNKLSKLPKSSLLLGSSTKTTDDNNIGQFGEGYKLALLVLLRNGIDVVIHNGHEKETWVPKLVKSKTFGTEVLAIDIYEPWFSKPANALTFMLSNIQNAQSILGAIQLDASKYEVIQTEHHGDILMHGETGNIYVNGLFVCKDSKLKHSYNIKPKYLKLGRDRDLVNDWDIRYTLAAMWTYVYNAQESLQKYIMRLIDKDTKDTSLMIHHTKYIGAYSNSGTTLGRDIYKDPKYAGKVPVSNEFERDRAIRKYGPKVQTVITSSQVVELTKNNITVKEIPTIPLKDRLHTFFKQHKKQFSKSMYKDFEIILKEA